ncbi:S46 family peptidase [Plebeiibacterium marinum]|uniref:Dipeptidyl-peptidase n=1 Tax=Plebeiibacterium marinum TaxID=2992111 RepID=A0AAE3SJX6_9BACT|nr:S46 family peptidase [Plebeiobacterium marinum]MCW3805913.1 S46 family peptidase [Plebeiobacterium marinum]
MKRWIAVLFIVVYSTLGVKAKEGMWIPILLEKYNIEEMQQMGFKLTAEDIYSVNKACMKDAVVLFGSGCTGELISDQGLLITNHHCGYRAIQSHSSVEHDYLTDGFWAKSRDEELPNDNLSVTFLKSMKDVTNEVMEGISDDLSEEEKDKIIEKNISSIKKEAIKDTHYKAELKPFFHSNQYFLFINEVYKDIRLVGAPPSAIGKFGGDTDNWMWPRHTGDFSLFRIYANKDNQPAEYAADNVPYKPGKHFAISMKGVQEDDFTMVFGYPGSTEQYAPSNHLTMITQKINPELIDVRTRKLEIIDSYKSDPAIRIKYAAKDASISNSWKRWIGEIRGLEKLDAINKKKDFEAGFKSWAASTNKYEDIFDEYDRLYEDYGDYRLVYYYINEVIFRNGAEMVRASSYLDKLVREFKKPKPDSVMVNLYKAEARSSFEKLFKDYHKPLDKEMTAMLLSIYQQRMKPEFLPDIYNEIQKKHKNNIEKYVDKLFAKSVFAEPELVFSFIDKFSAKSINKVQRDPAYVLYSSFYNLYRNKVAVVYGELNSKIEGLNKRYMAAQMEYQDDKVFYPDANLTLRVSYGKVRAYEPRDGVLYKNTTTLEGIIEKDNPDIYDYRVPERLKELHKNKDYGKYEVDGTVPVCFIATNHTTGGNSGSPVINANGELIGINFDRAWEGVMSDLMFNPVQCRNITLDIRYVLFLIDKFAGAGYLLEEMDIVM